MNEMQRQCALLALLADDSVDAAPLALRESGQRAALGIDAYRANAEASAERALAAAFPTVHAMLGAQGFGRAARELWRAHPPQLGDLGAWGEDFPAWLAQQPALVEWPWLADSARLDWVVHQSERAADAVLDAASLAHLESTDPPQLRIALMPGSALLTSAWPIASLHAAHRLEGDAADAAIAALRAPLAERRGESAFVVRQGWRGVVHRLEGAQLAWTQALLADANLADALERAGPGFDFTAWLATALRGGWLQAVATLRD